MTADMMDRVISMQPHFDSGLSDRGRNGTPKKDALLARLCGGALSCRRSRANAELNSLRLNGTLEDHDPLDIVRTAGFQARSHDADTTLMTVEAALA
jgi:hypothetical protein